MFDLADRDMADRDTEFGGVIRIKSDGKPAIEEMKPRVQGNDLRYESSQKMFDNAYTGLFHFHLHCQSYDNMQYAGPHLGDFAYAESTRANCLVFSFVSRKELNVDFYRHGPTCAKIEVKLKAMDANMRALAGSLLQHRRG